MTGAHENSVEQFSNYCYPIFNRSGNEAQKDLNKKIEETRMIPGHQQQDDLASLGTFASHHFSYQSKEIFRHASLCTHSYEHHKPAIRIYNLKIEKAA